MRTRRDAGLLLAATMLAGGLVGCAVGHTPSAGVAPTPNVPVVRGTVLVVRADHFVGLNRERDQLAQEIGDKVGGPRNPLVEVVVREDNGRTVVLMESSDDGWAAGERVLVAGGALLRDAGSLSR